jgi:hypothetical protein
LYADRSSEEEQLLIRPHLRKTKSTAMVGGWRLKFTFCFVATAHEPLHSQFDERSFVQWKIMDIFVKSQKYERRWKSLSWNHVPVCSIWRQEGRPHPTKCLLPEQLQHLGAGTSYPCSAQVINPRLLCLGREGPLSPRACTFMSCLYLLFFSSFLFSLENRVTWSKRWALYFVTSPVVEKFGIEIVRVLFVSVTWTRVPGNTEVWTVLSVRWQRFCVCFVRSIAQILHRTWIVSTKYINETHNREVLPVHMLRNFIL